MDPLLQPQMISRLKKLQWRSPTKLKSLHSGMRRSNQIGTSQEFSDYRTYEAGDDVRQIDWNVFARTEKLYIKRFLEERELTITILLDQSTSMSAFEPKWKMAKQLVASIATLSLHAGDRVSLRLEDGLQAKAVASKKGSFHIPRFHRAIQQVTASQNLMAFSLCLMKEAIPRTDVTIVISDGLEPPKDIDQALRRLQLGRSQIYYLQLLDEEELSPLYTGDWKLIDIENQSVIEVSMQHKILMAYDKSLQSHIQSIQSICMQKGIPYKLLPTNMTIEEMIFLHLKQIGWIH